MVDRQANDILYMLHTHPRRILIIYFLPRSVTSSVDHYAITSSTRRTKHFLPNLRGAPHYWPRHLKFTWCPVHGEKTTLQTLRPFYHRRYLFRPSVFCLAFAESNCKRRRRSVGKKQKKPLYCKSLGFELRKSITYSWDYSYVMFMQFRALFGDTLKMRNVCLIINRTILLMTAHFCRQKNW